MSNRASLNRIRVPYSCSCDKSKAPYTVCCLCRMTLLSLQMPFYDKWNPHSPTCSLSSWHLDEIPEELPTWAFPDLEICDHNTSDNAAVTSYNEAHDNPGAQRQGPSSPGGISDPAVVCRRLKSTSIVKFARKQRQNRQAQQRFQQRQKVRHRPAQKATVTRNRSLLSGLLLCRPESKNWMMRLRKHFLV